MQSLWKRRKIDMERETNGKEKLTGQNQEESEENFGHFMEDGIKKKKMEEKYQFILLHGEITALCMKFPRPANVTQTFTGYID